MSDKPKPKKSSVRHTRAVQRDRTKRPNTAPPDEQVEARLEELVHPATLNQVAHFHSLGLRERTLNLPVMMAFVLSLIWRQLGSVAEAVRTLNREGLLWVDERSVSQQAVEQRLGSLPAVLFERVLHELVPLCKPAFANARGPCLQPCAGLATTSLRLWPLMVPRSMPCCAKPACCVTAKDRCWRGVWLVWSMSSVACLSAFGMKKISTRTTSASGSEPWRCLNAAACCCLTWAF